MMTLSPSHDQVLIEPHDHQPTERGLHLPDRVREGRAAQAGRVIAVGPGRMSESGTFIEVHVKPGEIVMFPKNAGIVVDAANMSLRLIRDCELLGRLVEGSQIVPASVGVS